MWSGKFKNGESFHDLSDAEIEKFSDEIDENSVKELPNAPSPSTSNGFGYAKPEDYELLKQNVSAVGYSGLDENQKALFKSQFPSSKYAKAGGSFEDAVKYVDSQSEKGLHPDQYISQEEVDKRNANAGDAYTLGRDILTTGLSPYTAGLEYLKDRAFNEGSWAGGEGDSYAEYINKHMEAGNKGEGVVGFLGNPTNVIAAKLPLNAYGVAGMGGLAGGESVYHDVRNAEATGSPVDVTATGKNALLAGGLAAGIHGGISGASWLGQKTGQSIAQPYIQSQEEAARAIAENASKAERLAQIKKEAPGYAEFVDLMNAEERYGTPEFEAVLEKQRKVYDRARRADVREEAKLETPEEARLRRDRPELFQNEKFKPYDPAEEFGKQQEARVILGDVKRMMLADKKRFPEYQVGKVDLKGQPEGRLIQVSDEAAAKYLKELENQKAPDLTGKGFEILKGYPNVQRFLSAYAELPKKVVGVTLPGSELARGLADKSFVLPNLMNKPGIYQTPAHAVAPLVLRGSVAGSAKIDSAITKAKNKTGEKIHEGSRDLIRGIIQ